MSAPEFLYCFWHGGSHNERSVGYRYIKLFGHRINLDEIDYYLRDNGFITATIVNDNKFCSKYKKDQILKLNIAHNEGNYFTDKEHLKEYRKDYYEFNKEQI